MKLGFQLIILITGIFSCNNSASSIVCEMELDALGGMALHKTLREVANALHSEVGNLLLLKDKTGYVNGVTFYCQGKGNIRLFFAGVEIKANNMEDKVGVVKKLASQIIIAAEWITITGERGNVRAVKIY